MEFVSELHRSPETRILRILRALHVSYSVQRFDGFWIAFDFISLLTGTIEAQE